MNEAALSKGEVTRRNIIAAACELFSTQGYHGTSMRQIARKANIALSGLYNHFPGKDQVFQAVFLEYHPYHEILPALLNAKGETVEEVLHAALIQMNRILETNQKFLNLLFIEIVEFDSLHANELFAAIFPQIAQIAGQIYQQHQDRLRPITMPIFIRSFLVLFFAYYITEIVFAPRAPDIFREGALDNLLDVYLHGVLKNIND